MAKLKFNCDSGANIKSCKSEDIDTVDDLGLDEGEWEEMSEEDRYEVMLQWAYDGGLEIWAEPV